MFIPTAWFLIDNRHCVISGQVYCLMAVPKIDPPLAAKFNHRCFQSKVLLESYYSFSTFYT